MGTLSCFLSAFLRCHSYAIECTSQGLCVCIFGTFRAVHPSPLPIPDYVRHPKGHLWHVVSPCWFPALQLATTNQLSLHLYICTFKPVDMHGLLHCVFVHWHFARSVMFPLPYFKYALLWIIPIGMLGTYPCCGDTVCVPSGACVPHGRRYSYVELLRWNHTPSHLTVDTRSWPRSRLLWLWAWLPRTLCSSVYAPKQLGTHRDEDQSTFHVFKPNTTRLLCAFSHIFSLHSVSLLSVNVTTKAFCADFPQNGLIIH